MKRWILRILFCLILGAVMTVAVAWSIQLVLPPMAYEPGRAGLPFVDGSHMDNVEAARRLRHWFPNDPINEIDSWGFIDRRFGWEWWGVGWQPLPEDGYILDLLVDVISTGWPVRCFSGSIKQEYREARAVTIEKRRGTMELPEKWKTGRRASIPFIPCDPIWPGFVIDTLFYAAIWGGVWFGFTGGKRFIRTKRGRCPQCGYDLRGNLAAGCSECGWNREQEETERQRDEETK